MQITRTSVWSGKTRTLDLDITPAQLAAWEGGMVIQQAMPHLSAADREFLITKSFREAPGFIHGEGRKVGLKGQQPFPMAWT